MFREHIRIAYAPKLRIVRCIHDRQSLEKLLRLLRQSTATTADRGNYFILIDCTVSLE